MLACWWHGGRACNPTPERDQALRADHGGEEPRSRCTRGHVRRLARTERGRKVDDDAAPDRSGDRRRGRARSPRLHASRGVEGGSCTVRRRSAARQPRRDADGRAEPARLHAPLPDRPGRPPRCDRAGPADREPFRPSPRPGEQALGRHAPAPADRAGARPQTTAPPARRADRRPRPAGAPGALGARSTPCAPKEPRSSCPRTTSKRRSASPTR